MNSVRLCLRLFAGGPDGPLLVKISADFSPRKVDISCCGVSCWCQQTLCDFVQNDLSVRSGLLHLDNKMKNGAMGVDSEETMVYASVSDVITSTKALWKFSN